MKTKTLDTEIVFRDLTRANKKIRHQHKNPDAVRRWFTSFVTNSQKLTDTMRKEYNELTGRKWEASTFTGWTPITNLIKKLRNTDLHELPIRIRLLQTQVYHGFEAETNKPVEMRVQMGYTSEAGLEKGIPGEFAVEDLNQKQMLTPQERELEFQVEGIIAEIEKMIEKAAMRDVHALTAECYRTLSQYYGFYETELAANRKA